MSDKKYTPGPWEVTSDNGELWVDGEDSPVAMITGDAEGATELELCDANLIAAAPELLEVLELAHEHMKVWVVGYRQGQNVHNAVEKAIAKAKGNT